MRPTTPRRLSAALSIGVALSLGVMGCGDDGGSGGGGGGNGGNEGGGGETTTSLQMGTGSVGGIYFPLGQEYANLFEENADVDGLTVNAVESDGSVDNLAQIGRGDLQLGIAQNNTSISAVAGTGEFEGAALENVGLIGQLYPEAAQVITLEGNGIESVEDLAGKRVAVGPPGGGTRAAAEAILSAYGIEEGDYTAQAEGFADAQAKLQDGQIDAAIEVLGVPGSTLSELEATTKKAKLIPLDADKIEAIAGETDFESYEIPADAYDFLDEPVQTVAVFAVMIASTDQISEDVGYELTRVVYENAGDITLAQGDLIKVEDALVGRGDLPLHPGAEKYLKEQGVLD